MKKNPERYGGFFKNNIREGIGGTSATGGGMSGDGTVDLTKISDAQYFKLRKRESRRSWFEASTRSKKLSSQTESGKLINSATGSRWL